jgi:hypothetical protein
MTLLTYYLAGPAKYAEYLTRWSDSWGHDVEQVLLQSSAEQDARNARLDKVRIAGCRPGLARMLQQRLTKDVLHQWTLDAHAEYLRLIAAGVSPKDAETQADATLDEVEVDDGPARSAALAVLDRELSAYEAWIQAQEDMDLLPDAEWPAAYAARKAELDAAIAAIEESIR